jgi:hypothetical protein
MPIVAFDDFVFQRHGIQGLFKAPMGIGLTIPDEKGFAEQYDVLLDKLFEKYRKPRKKRIYKAAHLTAQLLDATTNFIDDFISAMSPYISRIDVYYSYFPANLIQRIFVFKDTHARWYDPLSFLRLIQNSYVHICAWRYLVLHPDCKNYDFHLDHFEGRVTPAWEAIREKENLYIYYSGNECNCYISAADLVLRHIQNKLKGAVVRKTICTCFEEIINGTHVDAYWLGPKKDILNNLSPNKDLDADTIPRTKHPIFVIAWQSPSSRASDRDTFEWTNTYSKIMETAYQNGGCARFWDPKQGPNLIDENQDIVILANDAAKPMVESIRSVFPKIKIDESLKQ